MDKDNFFGITEDDTLKDLRHKYLEMALLCHPDRGGTTEEMVVIQDNYEKAKHYLQLKDNSCDKLNTLDFCLAVLVLTPTGPSTSSSQIPNMQYIFDEIHNLDEIHTQDNGEETEDDSEPYVNMFKDERYGYGSTMMHSMYTTENTLSYSSTIGDTGSEGEPDTDVPVTKPSTELVEPWAQSSIGHILNERSITKEKGFSVPTETPRQLPLTDYHSAFYQTPLIHKDDLMKAEQYETIQKEDIRQREREHVYMN